MKAVVQTRYGAPDEVLEIREVPKPACGADEVLVRVRAASVHPDVWHMVTGRPYFLRCMGAGLRRPKNPIPGIDMAGEVEAVGGNVTGFAPGDAVFGESHTGFQWVNGGAYAEYVAVPSSVLALKPEAVPFAEAASVPTAGSLPSTIYEPVVRFKRATRCSSTELLGASGALRSSLPRRPVRTLRLSTQRTSSS